MKRTTLSLAILALAACSTPPEPVAPPPVAVVPPVSPVTPEPVVDQCGAASLQHLVGRPRTEIPIPVRPNLQRVACTTCPVTEDFNLSRLNFFFDAATGRIKEVRCG